MNGIDLNAPITFRHTSMRCFSPNTKHIDRICKDDVLLLILKGILRFSEDGTAREVSAGQYYIQQKGLPQQGVLVSDCPYYLYIHFSGQWSQQEDVLPFCGEFDINRLSEKIDKMDHLIQGNGTMAEKNLVFLDILTTLHRANHRSSKIRPFEKYISAHLNESISLEQLSKEFNYSKNHIINLFKTQCSMTPIEYINQLKLQKAKYLLEASSDPTEQIALACGFQNYSHFYRLFLRHTGKSPSQWRKQFR